MKSSNVGTIELAWRALVSSLIAIWLMCLPAAAHEIRPAIADVSVAPAQITITLTASAEVLVADLDLAGLDDTDQADGADEYDRLRALPPADLSARLSEVWPQIAEEFVIEAGGQRARPELIAAEIPEVGDLDLPRDSLLTLQAALPAGDAPVQVGWIAANGPLVVRQASGDAAYSAYLTDGALSDPIPRDGSLAEEPWLKAFGNYIVIGFEHIVPKGLDHILFVLGLFFFSLHLRPLLLQVSAFTLAHTVTLALGILGWVSVPASIVEPLIAASIVYVAVENILMKRLSPWRPAVVFCFGLLHGLGFASVLGEIGLNPARFVTGLIGFNIGVELGQLAVIAAAFLIVGLWFGRKPWYDRYIARPASAAIAIVGAWWFIERVFL